MRAIALSISALLAFGTADAPMNANLASGGLSDLAKTLAVVRSTKPTNTDRDAGPELTPVKTALRRWVEAQLPPPSKPGRIKGTIVTPDQQSLRELASRLTAELDEAGLTCGDFEASTYRCSKPDDFFASERGFVGAVRLGTLYSGPRQLLLLVTGVGVQCGEDQSAYVYEPSGNGWKLIFANERNDYRKGQYDPQNFFEIAVSQSEGTVEGNARSPLIATLGFSPWCSSNWNTLYTRLWRISPVDTTPKPLLDRTDGLYLGEDTPATAVLSGTDYLVEHYDGSIDPDRFVHPRVQHFRIAENDEVTRVSPIALDPESFVDEWLSGDWEEAAKWVSPQADAINLRRVRGDITHSDFLISFGDRVKRCRGGAPLYQVELSMDSRSDQVPGRHLTHYFQVSWEPPYEFAMVKVASQPIRGCDQPVSYAQMPSVLLPEMQWQPNS